MVIVENCPAVRQPEIFNSPISTWSYLDNFLLINVNSFINPFGETVGWIDDAEDETKTNMTNKTLTTFLSQTFCSLGLLLEDEETLPRGKLGPDKTNSGCVTAVY